ncbi:BQ2448_3378 [Microbotryum intermedium]|uniref:BQ2448_3378 protein n=1 Tax=Microbotryum intermedium TaxID=269621 RepID=A0A238FHT6_9BASI|nr:BQ2448_3378 [Microbotryum intermedium]
MASTAALMAGMQSFDSSDAGGPSRYEGVNHGGITFGSVAPSFHSEDYDEPPPIGSGAPITVPQHNDNAILQAQHQDESSLMDEQEIQPDPVESERLASRKVKTMTKTTATILSSNSGQPRPASSTSKASTAVASSSRNPSASTAATTEPSPKHASRYVSTGALHALDDSRGDGNDESKAVGDRTGLLNEMDLDDDSARWTGTKGKKAGKAKATGGGLGQNMTLREQEKVIDEFKKENFDLKLKIHFYEQRLERLAPDHIDQALRENVQLKVEFQTLRTELKRYKKLLIEGNRAIETLKIERDSATKSGSGASERERRLEKELARWRDASERERRNTEALEVRLEKQTREMRDLRNRSAELGSEDARTEIGRLRNELDAEREAREEDLGEQDDLRYRIRELERQLDEMVEQNIRLRDDADREDQSSARGDDSSIVGRGGRSQDLFQELATLRAESAAQRTMLAARGDELTTLQDQLEDTKHDIHDLELELQQQERMRARSERSMSIADRGKTIEQLEQENDEHRDRAAGHALEVEQLQIELAEKEREIEALLEEHDNRSQDQDLQIKQIDEEWREAVEEAEARKIEALDMLEEREDDVQDLSEKCKQLVQEIEELEIEREENAHERQALTSDLEKLAGQIRELEAELDEKDIKVDELAGALKTAERDVQEKQTTYDQMITAMQEQLGTHKARASELTIQHGAKELENKVLREKSEGLAVQLAALEAQFRAANESIRKLEDEAVEIMRALRKEEEEHEADQKDSARRRRELEVSWQSRFDEQRRELGQARDDVQHYKTVLDAREVDIQKLQEALNGLESSTRRLGESHVNDRFALDIECDRLKRDLARCEQELQLAKEDLEDKTASSRAKDMTLATLQSENKDLSKDLADQRQARLGLTDKHNAASRTLRDTQLELSAARDRLRVVEDQLSTDHRQLSRTENQYRDQLTERNTLLLTVHQYMDKIVGGSQRKSGQADPKPFTNFVIFHDSLISRLKSVNQLQASFDRRAREIETKFSDHFAALKRQHESRLKQLDRFEAAIKTATETQRQWRHRVHSKQAEVDAARAEVQNLQTQLSTLRSSASSSPSSPGMTSELSTLTKRAATAERRLAATQAQLRNAEDKLGDAREKVAVAEGKWEARLREMEARLRAAEEKVKRERQGAKERVAELTRTIKDLQTQVARAGQRAQLLEGVLDETEKNKRRVAAEL